VKANKAEQQALITLLNRIYGEIRAIEEEWSIRGSDNDYRPRIEYFHDAIRALSSGETGSRRLSVELLAYDISMLRHIQANPMKRTKGTKTSLSPGTDLVVHARQQKAGGSSETSVKSELAERYKSYALLFAALLSDAADRNYQNRMDERNSEVEDLATLEQMVKLTAKKQDVEIDIEVFADQYIDDPDMMNKILFAFHNAKQKKRMLASEAQRKLKEMMESNDKEIKTIEKAHFTFVTSQLAIYEGARDVVKKMATQGMNIVGQFVAAAVSEATRGGRGM
jgi:hypothetical protein